MTVFVSFSRARALKLPKKEEKGRKKEIKHP
jgi:hypothetical protein